MLLFAPFVQVHSSNISAKCQVTRWNSLQRKWQTDKKTGRQWRLSSKLFCLTQRNKKAIEIYIVLSYQWKPSPYRLFKDCSFFFLLSIELKNERSLQSIQKKLVLMNTIPLPRKVGVTIRYYIIPYDAVNSHKKIWHIINLLMDFQEIFHYRALLYDLKDCKYGSFRWNFSENIFWKYSNIL